MDLPTCTAMVAEESDRRPRFACSGKGILGIFTTERLLMQKGFVRMYFLRKGTVSFARV